MATNAIVPSAAPAVAAPTATPAATPTPVATPSPVATPNPSTTALSHDDSVKAMVDAATSKGFTDDLSKPPAETPAVEVAKPVEEAAPVAKEGDAAKPAEVAAQDDDPGYSLEEDGFIGPKDLAAKIEANPALKAALDADTRNEIMANARLAARTAEYEKHFASPVEAQIALESSQAYANFAEAFNSVNQDAEKGTTSFIMKLIEGAALRDDNGEIVRNEKGHTVEDGTASKLLTTIGKRWLNTNVIKKIEDLAAKGDENVKAALDFVMESVGLLPSTADKTDTDPALTARKAELDAQEARIRQERETSTQTAQKEYKVALQGDLQSLYETESGKIMALANGLDDFTKSAVSSQIATDFKAAIAKNVAYQTKKNQIRQRPMSAKRRADEIAHAKQFTRDNLVKIAAPILAKAGVAIKGKAEATAAAQAARAEGARSEVNGGAASQPGVRSQGGGSNLSPAQQYEQATASWKLANPGKDPSSSDITTFMMLQAVKNKGMAA